jgi:Mitochondrial PGP phosphatase
MPQNWNWPGIVSTLHALCLLKSWPNPDCIVQGFIITFFCCIDHFFGSLFLSSCFSNYIHVLFVLDINSIQFQKLPALGIKYIIFDKDNCLTLPYKHELYPLLTVDPNFKRAYGRFLSLVRMERLSDSFSTKRTMYDSV